MKHKFSWTKLILAIVLVLALVIIASLLITACVQNVSPAVQWHNWMQTLGFIKKSAEATAGASL